MELIVILGIISGGVSALVSAIKFVKWLKNKYWDKPLTNPTVSIDKKEQKDLSQEKDREEEDIISIVIEDQNNNQIASAYEVVSNTQHIRTVSNKPSEQTIDKVVTTIHHSRTSSRNMDNLSNQVISEVNHLRKVSVNLDLNQID